MKLFVKSYSIENQDGHECIIAGITKTAKENDDWYDYEEFEVEE